MIDYTYEFYNEIVQNVIGQNLNKIEAKNVLANLLEKYDVKPVENDPLRYDLKYNINQYIIDKERQGLSKITLQTYRLHLNIFSKFTDKKIQQITKQDIYDYLDYRQKTSNLQNSTLETVRAVLRSFFEWLKDEDIIKENPMMKMKPIKCKQSVVKYLTIEELELIRENCKNIREKALLEILYSTGARLSELTSLNIENVEFNNRTIKVLGKGNKERVTFFSPKASFYLKKYLSERDDNCEALFVTMRKEYRRISNRGVQRLISNLGNRAGVYLHVHKTRHTLASNLLNSGVEITVVKDILGHEDLNTTSVYAKATQSYKQQCYNRFFNQ